MLPCSCVVLTHSSILAVLKRLSPSVAVCHVFLNNQFTLLCRTSPDFRCSASVHKLDLRLRMGAASCQAAQNSQLYERSHILSFSVARMLRGAWLAISPQLNNSVQTNR